MIECFFHYANLHMKYDHWTICTNDIFGWHLIKTLISEICIVLNVTNQQEWKTNNFASNSNYKGRCLTVKCKRATWMNNLSHLSILNHDKSIASVSLGGSMFTYKNSTRSIMVHYVLYLVKSQQYIAWGHWIKQCVFYGLLASSWGLIFAQYLWCFPSYIGQNEYRIMMIFPKHIYKFSLNISRPNSKQI
jgi:hypothetical protein